jgi:flagellar biosynthesis/type III secretory pathway protein FliH
MLKQRKINEGRKEGREGGRERGREGGKEEEKLSIQNYYRFWSFSVSGGVITNT